MTKSVMIVGGGTAGWMTASYLARMLASAEPGGVRISVVESDDIGIIGVGEGTFPSIRKTLSRIGLAEADLIRSANATFKQGISFVNWRKGGASPDDRYFHPFQIASQADGLDLLPYWLAGTAGGGDWASVSTVQPRVSDASLAPKMITHPDYAGPLNYAYHFDAAAFARLLRDRAVSQGVVHTIDTIEAVTLGPDGAIESLSGRRSGRLSADLYIDCTGFRAQLIGQAMGVPFKSFRSELFTDRAVAIQVPYEQPGGAIASFTKAVAQPSGWIWDIGLQDRRGTGYVYSSDHTTDEEAERRLRDYLGAPAKDLPSRVLRFEAGFRETQWKKNCVAIGLSAGFIEPLEATGIGFAEIAGVILAGLFPWAGPVDLCADVFNAQMRTRYTHVIDFIKLHYCLSDRRDTAFWRDNVDRRSISDSLQTRLDQWRFRPPSFIDVDLKHDIFTEHNWQYVLYGMGYRTDIGERVGALRYFEDARAAFDNIRRQADYALQIMPPHRSLIEQVRLHGFERQKGV